MEKELRETFIEPWAKYIIPAVFRAEDKVRPQWEEKLRGVTKENAAEVAEAYCRAIATEIVDGNKEERDDSNKQRDIEHIHQCSE